MTRNTYPGKCYQCGLDVKPTTGHFERNRVTREWRVKHANIEGHARVTCEIAKKTERMRLIMRVEKTK